MGSTALPSFVSRARLLMAVASVAVLLLLGVLLLGWYAGSRASTSTPTGAAVGHGSPWSQSSGLLISDISDVDLLRSQGWTLPLAGMPGYELVSLRENSVTDEPSVRMVLRDQGGHEVLIIEQRGEIDPDHPTDGIVGLPSTTTGLDPSIIEGAPVRVRAGEPWRAQIVHEDVVYTLQSESSPAGMVQLVHHAEAADRATLALPPEETPSAGETIVEGWKRILGLGS